MFMNSSLSVTLRSKDSLMPEQLPRGYIDFHDPLALRELTYCLLRNDFSIELDIPLGSLCPAVPNRVNYICWIEDLVHNSTSSTITGIDIGTGSSCIYALLACTRNKSWKMVATDIDSNSVEYAIRNVNRNYLQQSISIVKNNTLKVFPPELFKDDQRYDFCLCNPPFYKDEQDILDSLALKAEQPSAVCLGSENEMMTDGGEVQFLQNMIDESLLLRDRIRWYTSMFGKRSSLKQTVVYLKSQKITNYITTTFHQGHTNRWAIAWSFGEERPTWESTRNISVKMAKLSAPTTVLSFDVSADSEAVLKTVESLLNSLQISHSRQVAQYEHAWAIQVQAVKNTWSRSARRARARELKEGVSSNAATEAPAAPVIKLDIRAEVVELPSKEPSAHSVSSSSSALMADYSSKTCTRLHFTWTFVAA
ncbi:hypothetical protein BGZ94_007654 [Podila epigama]|nr:hypothetical protein BGZ94_007654 [Podila epigama]